MIKRVKPGELLWCAEGGAVKQVEVAEQMYRCSNETGIKYPNDDVMQPWRVWDGYLFRSRKAAIKLAIKQAQKQLAADTADLVFLKEEIKRLQQQQQHQLESELEAT